MTFHIFTSDGPLYFGSEEMPVLGQGTSQYPPLDSWNTVPNMALRHSPLLGDEDLKHQMEAYEHILVRPGIDTEDPLLLCTNDGGGACPTMPEQVADGVTHTCSGVFGRPEFQNAYLYWRPYPEFVKVDPAYHPQGTPTPTADVPATGTVQKPGPRGAEEPERRRVPREKQKTVAGARLDLAAIDKANAGAVARAGSRSLRGVLGSEVLLISGLGDGFSNHSHQHRRLVEADQVVACTIAVGTSRSGGRGFMVAGRLSAAKKALVTASLQRISPGCGVEFVKTRGAGW
ncbi:hypothetical protein [Streptomyces sp. WAC06614]|uniref:hypothetical protein n=1 Tax=Streptomyces sp. WAC06614 TaxID=2487416 RepID=UPI000F7B5B60|nr:hypothetical protein [Streptomyces sp. WAC06614]RSS81847.1 hypothetical protein EF918_08945 [Streptomyces sp. WAC06614]